MDASDTENELQIVYSSLDENTRNELSKKDVQLILEAMHEWEAKDKAADNLFLKEYPGVDTYVYNKLSAENGGKYSTKQLKEVMSRQSEYLRESGAKVGESEFIKAKKRRNKRLALIIIFILMLLTFGPAYL